jgi:hypothetical protein
LPNLNYNFSVLISSGPSDHFENKISIGAYDKATVTVLAGTPAAPGTKTVHLQPDDVSKLRFLYITSDVYSQDDAKTLTYKTKDPGAEIRLDNAQILIGSSLIALLVEVKDFIIANRCDKDAHIDILVGRDVS